MPQSCGAVVKHRTRDREVPGSIPTNSKCCFLEQETLSTLLSTGFYPGKKRATWKISTKLLNVLPSINKVDYYYYYYYYEAQPSVRITGRRDKEQIRTPTNATHEIRQQRRTVTASEELPCHYENTPIQIYRTFHLQKLKISDKLYFSYLLKT